MSCLPAYPGISLIWHKSPCLPHGSPYKSRRKNNRLLIICLLLISFWFSPNFPNINFNSFTSRMNNVVLLGISHFWLCISSLIKLYCYIIIMGVTMEATGCRYSGLSHTQIMTWGLGWGGGGPFVGIMGRVSWYWVEVIPKKQSPDFKSPEFSTP